MTCFNFDAAFNNFREKCVVSEEDERLWKETVEYIESFGLTHEVFMSANNSYRDDMTHQEAVDAICIAMMDWDI